MNDQLLNQRVEILFIYDVTNNNPNGDPLDENKPRIDYNSGHNIVTDVRLKRTIRDYLLNYKKLNILVKQERKEDGDLKSKDEILKEIKSENKKDYIIKSFIDIRLFGCTLAVEKNTIALTGPVQFKFGKSLHKVDLQYIKGTTVMPSNNEKKQGTFTSKYILPYSCIAFHGVFNENASINQEMNVTYQDLELMFEAMWNGTNFLATTSKIGHRSLLLLSIFYKPQTLFQINNLDDFVKINSSKKDEEIRSLNDYSLQIDELLKKIEENKEKIDKIKIKKIPELNTNPDFENHNIGLPIEKYNF